MTFTITLYLFFRLPLYVRKAKHKSDCWGDYRCMWGYILLSRANKNSRLTVKFTETSSSCIFTLKSICSLWFIQKMLFQKILMYSSTIVGLEDTQIRTRHNPCLKDLPVYWVEEHMLADILSSIENLGQQVWPTQRLQSGHRWLWRGEKDSHTQVTVQERVKWSKPNTECKGIKSSC